MTLIGVRKVWERFGKGNLMHKSFRTALRVSSRRCSVSALAVAQERNEPLNETSPSNPR